MSLALAACGGSGTSGPATHALGGSVSGLTASGLVISNGSDSVSVGGGATSFSMPAAVATGDSYNLTVQSQPTGQTCSLANGSGTMPDADVLNAVVTCSANSYSLSGNVNGLATSGLVLANGGDTVAVASGATGFGLPAPVAYGGSYNVTVQTQPTGQVCAVANGSGQMGAAAVSNIQVSCTNQPFSVGGSISGLVGTGLVLANGSNTLNVAAGATGFTLPGNVAYGSNYAVTVQTQPGGLTCSVANGVGTMGAANVTNVAVTCAANSYSVGGSIAGLTSTGLVLANGGDTLSVAANATSFTLPAAVAYGGGYAVSVQTQPTGLTCSVVNGSGTMGAGNVTDVAVTCAVASYTLGGSITGLTASNLVLANGSNTLGVAVNATTFTMNQPVAYGSAYAVTVQGQPVAMNCTVNNGSGTMGAANVTSVAVACSNRYTVSTLAGSGVVGAVDGVGTAAAFNYPASVAVDGAGVLYVADYFNHRIRKIATDGTVTTLAGSGTAGYADGVGVAAQFNLPSSVAVDGNGVVYVADRYNHRIRRIATDGTVTTLAGSTAGFVDGIGAAANFQLPSGIAVDGSGVVYVADSYNHAIRKIATDGTVSTLAGAGTAGFADGLGAAALFYYPWDVAVDGGGVVYVADYQNHRVRKIASNGAVTTLAGADPTGTADGIGSAARFHSPYGISVDSSGVVYVADRGNSRIRSVAPDGTVLTVAGLGGAGGYAEGGGSVARFNFPNDVAVGSNGILYVADYGNHRIRQLTPVGLQQ